MPDSRNRQGPATPGDADFDWSEYDTWRANTPDPVAEAKAALARTDPTSQRLADLTLQAHQESLPSPQNAFGNEIGRTIGQASLAALKAPLGALHPLDTLSAMGGAASEAIQHPSEIGPAFKAGIQDPEVMGGALGSALMLADADPIASAGRSTAGALGRGTSAVGRGMETAGAAMADSKVGGLGIPGLGIAEAVLRGDPKGLAVAAAPYALKYGGKGLQKVGGSLEALKSASLPNPRLGAAEPAPERPAVTVPEGPSPHEYETLPSGVNPNFQQATNMAPTTAQIRAARYAGRTNTTRPSATQSGGDTGSFKSPSPTSDSTPPVDLTASLNALKSKAKLPQARPSTARSKWFGR